MGYRTLEEAETANDAVLSVATVCNILHIQQANFRHQARNRPERLGFPVIIVGQRILTPREPFIQYIRKGEQAP